MSEFSLLVDETSIQNQNFYDPVNSKYTGLVEYGSTLIENGKTPVLEALFLCW